MKEQARLAKARVSSYARTADDKTRLANALADPATTDKLRRVVKPPDPSKSLKKAGAILLLAPDPVSAVPGVVLMSAGFAMKRREPLSIESIVKETTKIVRDLQELI